MDFNFLNQNTNQNKSKKTKGGSGFGSNVALMVFIFMLITAAYLAVSGDSKVTSEIPISVLAKNISNGEVKKILVEGDKLTITYINKDEVKTAKKDVYYFLFLLKEMPCL